jgi:acyl-coenzyme A thioesterase PaaI-like protein
MAQIIKHRRGSLESLSTVTGSLQKGEIVIASGSTNLTASNGSGIAFIVPTDGTVQATNRIIRGTTAPNTFPGSTYGGMLNGVPFYASSSTQLPTLFLLGQDGNEAINLVGNIQPFSQSVATSINALSASIGSGTIGTSVSALNTFSGAVLTQLSTIGTVTASYDGRFTSLATVTGSLISSASAAKTTNDAQDVSITNLNSFSSSQISKDATLATYTGSIDTRLTQIGVVTGSLIASASNDAISISNINTFSASQISKDATLATYTGSVDTKFSTLGTYTASLETKNSALATITGSLIASASAAAISVANLNSASGSYSKLSGGNVFTGQQVISGSLYVTADLVVQGSSSIQNITSSNLTLGSAFVTLNTATPISRFAGLQIIDSGSSGGSGSFLYDALQDEFIFVHRGNGTNVTSSHFVLGPETYDNLGNETYLTNNRLTKGTGKEHLVDSTITDDGTTVSFTGNLDVTGSIKAPQLNAIATITGSLILSASAAAIANTNQNTFTSSALGRLSNLETTSASVVSSVAALNAYTSSNTSTTALNAFTASAEGRFTTLATYTGSVEGRFTTLATYTGSVNSRLDQLSTASGSAITRLTALEVETANLEGFSSSALTRLTALEVETANLELFSGSANTRFTEIGVVSGSLIASASAAKITNDSQGVSITNLNTFSASINTSVSNLNTHTASALTRLTALEVETANLELFSGSQLGKDATLATYTGSVETRLTQIGVVSGSLILSASNAASRLTTLEGTGTIQGLGTSNNVTFAKVTTTGDVVVGGDLVVQGNTVTLNTAQLVVEDKLITLASGSTSNATADGAGIEVAGTSASFKYNGTTNQFSSSVALASNVTGSINLGSAAGSSKRVAFRNTNGNLDLVPTASVDGDLLQWNGTDFVMSNTIDGGSF